MSIYRYFDDKYQLRRLRREYEQAKSDLEQSEFAIEEYKETGRRAWRSDLTELELRKLADRSHSKLQELKPLIEERIRCMREELIGFVARAIDAESSATLETDSENCRLDSEHALKTGRVLRDDGQTRTLPFAGVMHTYAQLLDDLDFELQDALKRRQEEDPIMKRNLELRKENTALKETVHTMEQTIEQLQLDLKRATANESSEIEKTAKKLLADAAVKAKIFVTIDQQHEETRDGVPEERRRDIDRIFNSIKSQLREEL